MKEHGRKALSSHNSRDVWGFINAATFRSKGTSDLPLDLEVLNIALSEIVKNPHNFQLIGPCSCDNIDSFVFKPITSSQALSALSKLKTSTATGPDELPATLLKGLAPIIAPTIARVFNLSFSQSTVACHGHGIQGY